MQLVHHFASTGWCELELPPSDARLSHMPNIRWGKAGQMFSPSFWRFQHWVEIEIEPKAAPCCRLGNGTLFEEVIACLLGGHGLPAETSLAYFRKMKSTGFLCEQRSLEDVTQFLREPVLIGGSPRRYRFWKSKAKAIWSIMAQHRNQIEALECSNLSAPQTRNKLAELPGIGLKTASWICRNWMDCDEMAVLDIHILRALANLGCTVPPIHDPKRYLEVENQFLAFAKSLQLPARTLDLVMWAIGRQFPTSYTK